jgi:Flp pilus assembly protein TadD
VLGGVCPLFSELAMADAAPPSCMTRQIGRGLIGICAVTLTVALGGCVTDKRDVTGSIARPTSGPVAPDDARALAAKWGDRYRANPSDNAAGLNYVRALRDLTQYQQAVAVLEDLAVKNSSDPEVLSAYGKALSDVGRFKEAAQVLARSQNPQNPNWRTLSAQGSVSDQLGDHVQAQAYYATALKIQPDDPGVLTNLGLSYALSGKLPLAEGTIRQASQQPGADMRVRQNLALVLALEGKDGEAEQVAQTDLPPNEAKANIVSIRAMIARSETWRGIRNGSPAPAAGHFMAQRLQAALASQ